MVHIISFPPKGASFFFLATLVFDFLLLTYPPSPPLLLPFFSSPSPTFLPPFYVYFYSCLVCPPLESCR
ncbi:hypothetical protein J3F83DRAFT_735798 [Trichoderma novae-zelandiae]